MSDDNLKQQFKLHLPGLLTVLSENLYSTKKVAIRELLQNANDSIVRRRAQSGERFYKPRITVSLDSANRTIYIKDNGFGLDEKDIETYLATIGRSYTSELRDQLSLFNPDEATSLIGQFGLGFLSAFLLATEVTVITRRMNPDGGEEETFRFHCSNDGHYTITPAERDEPGTTVELVIKPDASFMLQETILVETLRRYADFLAVPIYLEGDPSPVNLMTPPWEAGDVHRATLDYILREFDHTDPLVVFQLEDIHVDLGHDEMLVPLKGFLYIPPSSVASLQEYGDITVFIRRMFIREDQRTLLPTWARFVRGVIDCPELQPTASREDLHEDDTFLFVQQALQSQLLKALKDVAENQPKIWAQIVRGHSQIIMRWAIKDNEFFEHVADLLTVQTSRGNLTLPEYLKLTNGTMYFVTRQIGSLQEQLLAEGHDVPVIDASWFSVEPFLQKYALRNNSVNMVQMDGDSKSLMRPVDTEPFAALLDYFKNRGIRSRVSAFKPISVPATMIYPRDAEFIQETRTALDAGEIPNALASMVSGYIDGLNTTDEELRGTLYLNASNSLIRRLMESPPDAAIRDAILAMLYQFARLFSGRTLTAKDATGAFEEITQSIEAMFKD